MHKNAFMHVSTKEDVLTMSYQNDFSERVDNIGNLKISEDVVASITRIAAKEKRSVFISPYFSLS